MNSLVVLSVLLVSVAAFDVLRQPIEANSKLLYRIALDASPRITRGQNATKGQFPYQAGLKLKTATGKAFCGGILISSQDVLTAAHCCERVEEVEVILGSIEIHNENETGRVSLTVLKENITIHEKWNPKTIANDICILNLPEEVQFSDSIGPAALPKNNSLNNVGSDVLACGWGLVSDKSKGISPFLQFISVKVISNAACGSRYPGGVKNTNICTSGQGGKSTCSGDSGGSLVLASDRTLVGLTSFGSSYGCEKGWPPVFTRISPYLNWIKENMKTVEG